MRRALGSPSSMLLAGWYLGLVFGVGAFEGFPLVMFAATAAAGVLAWLIINEETRPAPTRAPK